MSSHNQETAPATGARQEPHSFYEVNLFALGRVLFHLHSLNKDAEIAAALHGRTATAIVEKSVVDALYRLVPGGSQLEGLAQTCDPRTEPDCPDMLFG